uniref:Uncharacterized protein n=1 Tax=Micrurus surinamensis TaxID=129470 RepID=A0A2D4PGQ3_MICSU
MLSLLHFTSIHTVTMGKRTLGVNLFSKTPESRTRSNGWKLIKKRINLELRRHFLTEQLISGTSCLQKLWVLQPTLEIFKNRLGNHLVWYRVSCLSKGFD